MSDNLYLFGFERTRYVTLEYEVALAYDLNTTTQSLPSGGQKRYFPVPRLRLADIEPTDYGRMPGCTFKIGEMRLKFR